MRGEPQVTYRMASDLTEDQIAEARQTLIELAKILGRATAKACHKRGITFDMDDPQVARDVMAAAFEGLVMSKPRNRGKAVK